MKSLRFRWYESIKKQFQQLEFYFYYAVQIGVTVSFGKKGLTCREINLLEACQYFYSIHCLRLACV